MTMKLLAVYFASKALLQDIKNGQMASESIDRLERALNGVNLPSKDSE